MSKQPAGRLEIETKPKVPAYKPVLRVMEPGRPNTIRPFALNLVPAPLFELEQAVSVMKSVWMALRLPSHSVHSF
jgi:hypothetical protein